MGRVGVIEDRDVRRGTGTDSVMVKGGLRLKVTGGENRRLELGKLRDGRKHEGDREKRREACC